jgi:hypothetical protein
MTLYDRWCPFPGSATHLSREPTGFGSLQPIAACANADPIKDKCECMVPPCTSLSFL